MAQDIKLKIDGDASGLIATVKAALSQIEQASKKMNITPNIAKPGGPGASFQAGSEAHREFQRNFQAVRAQENKSRVEQEAYQKTKKNLEEVGRLLANNAKQERKSDQDKVFYEKEKNNLLKERVTLQGTLQRMEKSGVNGPLPNGPQGKLGGVGFAGAVGGIATAVIQGINQIAGSPSRTLLAGGSAVSGTVGREMSSLYNGSLPERLAFNKERTEAKEMADKQEAAERAKDAAKTAAAAALGMGAGAMALGAGWTGVGMLGAGGTALASLGTLFSSQRMRAKTTSALTKGIFPGLSKQQNDEYESLIAQQNAEDFNRNYESKKQLNPTKVLATEEYNRNSQRDLDFQRQMGLNTQSFRGTFKKSIYDAGFEDIQGMSMAGSIMGAGGSTRSATGNAALGLQAQRNLDMTNAGGVIGTLSKSMGGAGTTKEAFVKILAEGTKVGLDGSDFREENRKFVETAAQMVSAAGVTTGGGVDQLLSEIGKFFGDKTNTGIEAGKSAFDLYRQTSMATTGPRGTMRAAGMLSDPTISRLGRDSREALFNMPIDQLTPDNPAIIAMARELGGKTTPEDIINAQNKITGKSANLFKKSDIARDRLANIKKKYGVSSAIGFQGPLSPGSYDEISGALGISNIAQVKEHPELGQYQKLTSAYSDALSAGDVQKQNSVLEEAKRKQLEGPGQGRPEDETNRIRAEMSKAVNQIFLDMKDSIVPAAGAAANFVEQIKKLNAVMMALPESERAAYANKNILPVFGHAPTTAPSAGSPDSGGGSGH